MGLKLVDIGPGYAVVEMFFSRDKGNIFGMAHRGAVFSLIDEAFEVAANSHGTVAWALNMNVTYHSAPVRGELLRAEAREINKTSKTGSYIIRVVNEKGILIATCQALAYRKIDQLSFLADGKNKRV
jgi:acyl-CoA thioesterase